MNFYYLLATQYVNAGDFAINRLLVERLSDYGEVCVDDSSAPESFKEMFRSKFESKSRVRFCKSGFRKPGFLLKNALQIRKYRPWLILPPGAMGSPKRIILKLKFLLRLLWIASYKLLGGKVAIFGISLPESKLGKIELLFLKTLDSVGVRSLSDVERLNRLGVSCVYFPDLVLQQEENNQKKDDSPSLEYPYVVLSLREHSRDIPISAGVEKTIKELALLCLEKEWTIRIASQVGFDENLIETVSSHFLDTGVSFSCATGLSEAEARSIYKEAQIVVSNRLHVCLFALSERSVAIVLVDGPGKNKIKDLFDSINLNSLLVDPTNSNSMDQIRSVINCREKYLMMYEDIASSQRQIATKYMNLIFNSSGLQIHSN